MRYLASRRLTTWELGRRPCGPAERPYTTCFTCSAGAPTRGLRAAPQSVVTDPRQLALEITPHDCSFWATPCPTGGRP